MFGDSAIKHSKRLALIVHLKKLSKDRLARIDRLNGEKTDTTLLGVTLPRVTLPVAPGRNLAVLVEAAVRNFALYGKGYDAVADFTSRQREYMGKGLAT